MSLDHLWAGWRSAYVSSVLDERLAGPEGAEGGSLFERILTSGLPDEEVFVVRRGERCSVLLNVYPYTNGHLMVLPNRPVTELEDLEPDEEREMWALVREGVVALKRAFRCEGVNIGLNLGAAAGAGVPGHLHVHVLPRWGGDTNFMTTVANTRVLPVSLQSSWQALREAWPGE
jgi:ATP adenylyltransferase